MLFCEEMTYFRDSSTATATETVIPTMGLLPAPRKPRKLRLRLEEHLKNHNFHNKMTVF